ncbi:MAG: hypothetical protein KDB80_17120 [Planctomycetes bacterium]|nr:hypothetical protein [Planctomycetota bacterium]
MTLGLAILGAAGLASAQTVTTVVDNGDPSELYDIVILGDGYQASEQSQFDADVADIVAAFQTGINFPYNAYFGCYNVHSVFRASVESGADHPDADPVITRNTAYDASYNTGGTPRCLYLSTSAGRALASSDAALAPDSDGRVIVLVNDSRYGGCASTFAVSYNGGSMESVQAHEWGHSFGGLADEYDYGADGTYSGPEFAQPNVTNSSTGNKWAAWLGETGIQSVVGAYEGARYYATGVWRPETNCKMRSNGVHFCSICREHLIKRFHEEVNMIADPTPTGLVSLASGETQLLSFTNRIANRPNHTIEWRVDGGTWALGSDSFVANADVLGTGNHLIEVRVTDTSQAVRFVAPSLLQHNHTWSIEVGAVPGLAMSVGTGCPSTLPTTIYTFATPTIGASFVLGFFNMPTSATVAVFMLGTPTSAPLDVIGMEGCSLYTTGDVATISALFSPGATTGAGIIDLPNDGGLIGEVWTTQLAAIAIGTTTLGVITSNGIQMTIGN